MDVGVGEEIMTCSVAVGMGSSLMAVGCPPRTDKTSAPNTVAAMMRPMTNPLERLLTPLITSAYAS